jgi:hypothetical protein
MGSREAILMTSYYEMVERKKFQLALRRVVDFEQAIRKAARVLENVISGRSQIAP